MTGENLKQGLEGLSKIEGISDFLFVAIYWIAVIFVILLIAYIFATVNCYINRKRRGTSSKDNDDFLDD
jgi:preprotein translocase subunit SecG